MTLKPNRLQSFTPRTETGPLLSYLFLYQSPVHSKGNSHDTTPCNGSSFHSRTGWGGLGRHGPIVKKITRFTLHDPPRVPAVVRAYPLPFIIGPPGGVVVVRQFRPRAGTGGCSCSKSPHNVAPGAIRIEQREIRRNEAELGSRLISS